MAQSQGWGGKLEPVQGLEEQGSPHAVSRPHALHPHSYATALPCPLAPRWCTTRCRAGRATSASASPGRTCPRTPRSEWGAGAAPRGSMWGLGERRAGGGARGEGAHALAPAKQLAAATWRSHASLSAFRVQAPAPTPAQARALGSAALSLLAPGWPLLCAQVRAVRGAGHWRAHQVDRRGARPPGHGRQARRGGGGGGAVESPGRGYGSVAPGCAKGALPGAPPLPLACYTVDTRAAKEAKAGKR